jgi:hypothetical protein
MNRTKKKIYAEELIDIKKSLEKRFGCTITSNKDSSSIKAIASALDTLGIKDKEAFMKEVAITLYKTIYLPFEFGNLFYEPLQQLELVAHELEHILQWNEEGILKFSIDYLTKPEKRSELETKALSANLEFLWRTTGKMPEPKDLSSHLRWYRIGSKDIKVAEKHLAILANILKQGGNYSIPVEAIMQLI